MVTETGRCQIAGTGWRPSVTGSSCLNGLQHSCQERMGPSPTEGETWDDLPEKLSAYDRCYTILVHTSVGRRQ